MLRGLSFVDLRFDLAACRVRHQGLLYDARLPALEKSLCLYRSVPSSHPHGLMPRPCMMSDRYIGSARPFLNQSRPFVLGSGVTKFETIHVPSSSCFYHRGGTLKYPSLLTTAYVHDQGQRQVKESTAREVADIGRMIT